MDFQLGELVKKIEQELQGSKQELTEKKVQYEKCVSTVSELEQTIKTYGTEREGRLKALEKTIKSLKSEMQSMSKQLKVAYFFNVAKADLFLNLQSLFNKRCVSLL